MNMILIKKANIETGYDSLSTGFSRQIILCRSIEFVERKVEYYFESKMYIYELQGLGYPGILFSSMFLKFSWNFKA